MIKQISSKQNPIIKDAVKLTDSKYAQTQGLFKVEGFHNLEMALASGVVKTVFATKPVDSLPENIEQIIVTEEILFKLASTKNPQGVVAICSLIEQDKNFGDRILYLDGVSDPGNLGTLLRTALAFGYNDVILGEGCVSQYNDKVLQSAQGAIFNLNIVNNFDLKLLKNYQIIATEIKGSADLDTLKPELKHVLVLGNESHGVSEKILKLADKRVRIEIKNIESLNVAIAGAIAMYKLSRQQ